MNCNTDTSSTRQYLSSSTPKVLHRRHRSDDLERRSLCHAQPLPRSSAPTLSPIPCPQFLNSQPLRSPSRGSRHGSPRAQFLPPQIQRCDLQTSDRVLSPGRQDEQYQDPPHGGLQDGEIGHALLNKDAFNYSQGRFQSEQPLRGDGLVEWGEGEVRHTETKGSRNEVQRRLGDG